MQPQQQQALQRLRCAHCEECIRQDERQRNIEAAIQTVTDRRKHRLLNKAWWKVFFWRKQHECSSGEGGTQGKS